MLTIDLNADLGETTAGNPVADDAAMLKLVSSANIACGFHAGDAHSIASTLKAAAAHNVTVGAHPSYNDAAGFGRRFMDYAPAQLADEVLYQIGALDTLARANGTQVRYVKPHGALYNAIVHNEAQAKAVIDAIRAFDRSLPVMLLPGGVAVDIAKNKGLEVITEAFADRGYQPDGTLVARTQPGAVLSSVEEVVERVIQLATHGTITAVDGSILNVGARSVCVHGDSPGSVAMTEAIAKQLKAENIRIASAL